MGYNHKSLMVLTLLQPPTEKQYLASVTFVAGKTKTPSKSVMVYAQ
jgi:hypothetical protein